MRLSRSTIGPRPSASRMDGRPSGFTGSWTSWRNVSAPSSATSASPTTGAWTSASTPPTSSFGGRPSCRLSTATSRAPPSIPSNRTTSPHFWVRSWSPKFQGEMGNRFNIRIEGTRIKHTMGPVSLKLYDKFGLILRIETTVNDVSFFRHYRKVEHRDGTSETKWAPMLKTVYSLPALRELLVAANRRYLEFLSTIDDPGAGINKLTRVSQTVQQNERSYPGFNFFDDDDQMRRVQHQRIAEQDPTAAPP